MKLSSLAQTYRSMQRLREILLVLSRHGFSQVLEATGLARFLPLSRRLRRRAGLEGDTPIPVQLRMALEDLGPTFVKLGQMLSTRPDLVPPLFVDEFRKLQDDVPPFSFAEVSRIVEEETGAPLAGSALTVDPQPLAAASIAQVHRARLGDGTRVVLKVQRPGIERLVSQDLAILYLLAGFAGRHIEELRDVDLGTIVDEFARTIRGELDFFREASHVERFRKSFEAFEGVVIPAVHWELTTRRLLVLDEIDGQPIRARDELAARGIDPGRIARIATRCFLKQVFEDGVFHGDLHGGNLLVTPDGQIGLVDFGAVGYLSEEVQDGLGGIFIALVTRDYPAMAEGYLRLGAVDDTVSLRRFERDLRELIEPYYGRPLKDLRLGEILRESAQIALRHRIRIPPDVVLLARSTVTIEGVARVLDPDFVLLDEAIPYARRLLLRHLDPRRRAKILLRSTRDLSDLAAALPGQVTRIFQKLLEGKIAIDFVHKGYEKVVDEMDRSSNRISLGLVVSALIVGSALVGLSEKGPLLWGFPVFGILGFLLAGFLGFGLAIAILRSGKF
ncbi:MAG: AarF/ABC1/UbiB kinase family protein [Deltaproteobacteria bacterium]|nr:AarF/ABC1/UbiB kinase family protein [Deltaproteobacteria bacterium]